MDRFWDKVEKTDTCWLWKAHTNQFGYGVFRLNGKLQKVHRVAYSLSVGEIESGLVIDHLCRNKSCCNPDHLEAVTILENNLRYVATITHCKQGHEYTSETIYINSNGARECLWCKRERNKQYKLRKKGQLING